MRREEMKKLREIVDEFGQLPIELSIYLDDNVRKIEVDAWYLQQVLRNFIELERLAKTHIAPIDIPLTIKYLLDAVPKKNRKFLT